MADEFLMKPKIDFAFKELMVNDKVRLGFLSAVLGIDPSEIRETHILNSELRREHEDEKQGILDVHILLNNDTELDTEINLAYMSYWADRSLFYVSKLIAAQLTPGENYDKLRKCIGISILDFRLFKNDEEYYSCFHLREDVRSFLYTEKVEFHVIELPKLPEFTKERIENCKDPRMLWAEFIRAERKEEFQMLAGQNQYIGEAYDQLKVISQDEQKRWEYLSREKAVRDHAQYVWEAEQREKNALKRGHEEGFEEGREEGIAACVALLKELSLSKDNIVSKMMQKFKLSQEKAKAKVEQYWDS